MQTILRLTTYDNESPIDLLNKDCWNARLRFERALGVMSCYLESDQSCEVVATSRGYTVMFWDKKLDNWRDVVCCKTPDNLLTKLIDAYGTFLSDEKSRNPSYSKVSEDAEVQEMLQRIEDATRGFEMPFIRNSE